MTLVHLSLTVFVLQNIGKCYLSTDINKTLHRIQKEIRALEQKMGLLYKYCQLQRDNICGPCVCRDDDRLSKKYYCDCRNLEVKRDCVEHRKLNNINGVNKINQHKYRTIHVYCDQTTDGGGWTVFQRRIDGSVFLSRLGKLHEWFWSTAK